MPFKVINALRKKRGLMTVDEIVVLIETGNAIFDPFSTLISSGVQIGLGNTIYPGVNLICSVGAPLTIGDNNTFHGNTLIEASSGPIMIGNGNQFGEGGFFAKTNRAGAAITIGDDGRFMGGAAIFGETVLGNGSQILGAISVQDCHLASGATFREPDPDMRAGLLKGHGTARNMTVPMGHVIVGNGSFSADALALQSVYHPKQ